MWHCLPWNWLKMSVSAKKVLWLLTSSDDMYGACPWSSWSIPVDIVVETRVKNCSKVVSEVVIKCNPNFITWLTTCAQKLMKIWKTKIGVKFWILLLLPQISYIFVAFTKDLNILQKSTENWTFAISFTLLCKSGNAWVKYFAVA